MEKLHSKHLHLYLSVPLGNELLFLAIFSHLLFLFLSILHMKQTRRIKASLSLSPPTAPCPLRRCECEKWEGVEGMELYICLEEYKEKQLKLSSHDETNADTFDTGCISFLYLYFGLPSSQNLLFLYNILATLAAGLQKLQRHAVGRVQIETCHEI